MYQFLKLVHVLAVILFLGNIITGLFWKMHADQTRDVRFISHTMRGIIRSDRWFTIPGVVIITTSGIFAAIQAGLPLLRTGWILWSLIAFTVSGIVFALFVGPMQKEIVRFADSPDFDWTTYKRKSLKWELWGLVATVTPLIAVVLMVLKRPA